MKHKDGEHVYPNRIEVYKDNKLHCVDRPAKISIDGTTEWYFNGKRHNEKGPAITKKNGTKEWYLNGQRHNNEGPAIIKQSGDLYFYVNGKCHRGDGPAVEYKEITDESRYFIRGVELTKVDYEKLPRDKDNKIHSKEYITIRDKEKNKNFKIWCFHGYFCQSKEEFNSLLLNELLPDRKDGNKPIKNKI